ncbi:coiled-coil domain-containing protein 166 [Patagioenas fasciata]|uniref:coiled-coil domain-containing protein 166 n=1 Tax=Patagioenas fasciata TaxID=372321 RepID=UPI003A9A4EC1
MAAKTKSMKQDTSAGKNKQGVTTKNGDVSQEISDMEALVSERKLYLQKEYKTLTDHVNAYMGTVEHFLQENKFLEKEAKQNEEESNAYLSYITKHSQKCQNMIITLNDQNHTDLSQVQKEKEELISQYTEKEKEVRSRLTNVETKYSVMSKELEDLQPFRAPSLQLEQRKRIKELEKELLVTKVWYADQMHTIKSRFLKAKADCELDFQQKMQFLTKRAEEAAILSLIQHIQQVKAENCRLRQELLSLIQYSTILKETKAELLDQQEQLLREQQYLQGVAQARRWLRGVHGANSASRGPRGPRRSSRCAQ